MSCSIKTNNKVEKRSCFIFQVMGNYILKTCESKPWTNYPKNKEEINNNLKNPLEDLLANKNMQ